MTIDTRGKLCPMPLIMLKKGLAQCHAGNEICVLTDNETACGNLNDYLRELKVQPQQSVLTDENGKTYTQLHFCVPATADTAPQAMAECAPIPNPEQAPYGVVIAGDEMGSGDAELGKILMRAFVNALIEMAQMPRFVILYNRGVLLATEGSDTADTLTRLHAEKGVDIICCGTCADYYAVRDNLAVGRISNMYTIMEMQSRVARILRP